MAKDVYQLLAEDHRVLFALVERLKGTDRGWERRRLLEEISLELIPHAMAEEAVFYARLDEVGGALDEHARMEELVSSLHEVADDGGTFEERLGQLEQSLREHTAREEQELFEAARRRMDEVEAVRLAAEVSEAKQEVRGRLVHAAEQARLDRLGGRPASP